MEYESLLGKRGRRASDQVIWDLRISEILNDILGKEKDEYLGALYLEQLDEKDAAVFRLNVFQDMLRKEVYDEVVKFVEKIRECMRILELEKEAYEQHKPGLHLDAALEYIEALESFHEKLSSVKIGSEGLKHFLVYLNSIIESETFRSMKERAYEAKAAREKIKVRVKIIGDKIKVWSYDDGEDLASFIEALFARFKGSGQVEEVKYHRTAGEMSHIHAAILEGAFGFFKEEYNILRKFSEDFPSIIDEGVRNFSKEAEFYISYVKFMRRIEEKGYPFVIPRFTTDGSIKVKGFYSPLLAKIGKAIPNDIETDGEKRIFTITGMNGGGKTTFSISFGQLSYLSKLGVPVPASEAMLPFFSSIMTAFPIEEDKGEELSRLEHDVVRAWNILKSANDSSLVITNELFSTTTSEEGFQLAELFLGELNKKRAYCLYVTFIPKVASLSYVISLVAMPSPEEPLRPSYKILPGSPPAEYMAIRIAAKYQLVYEKLKGMLG
jgi:DNA mismatch repair ATPase MutS